MLLSHTVSHTPEQSSRNWPTVNITGSRVSQSRLACEVGGLKHNRTLGAESIGVYHEV
jgi:hypothetical protein